jgi:ferredoxin
VAWVVRTAAKQLSRYWFRAKGLTDMLERMGNYDLITRERTVAKTHKVTFKKSGITLDIAEDEYILEEAEEAGLHLPYDCRSGTCTTCIQKCLEGEVDQDMAFAIGDEELDQGLRLICIGSPLSDVVLDA